MILALLIGLAFGFFGSMPVAGPTAVVVVARGLDDRRAEGLEIAAGAAAAEAVYAWMAFWGLTAILHRFPSMLPVSRIVGAVVLVALGVYLCVRGDGKGGDGGKAPRPERAPWFRNVALGLSMTALNPTLLVTWTAAVGAAHSTGVLRVHALDAFPFAGGVAAGIVLWFTTLLWLLSRFRDKAKPRTVSWTIRGFGVFLVLLGCGLAARVLATWGQPPPDTATAAPSAEERAELSSPCAGCAR